MIPHLIDQKIHKGIYYWLSSSGRTGASFKCTPIDLEMSDPGQTERTLEIALRHLPDDLFIKWHLFSDIVSEGNQNHGRAAAIEEVGQLRTFLVVHFELKSNSVINNVLSHKRGNKEEGSKDFFDIACEKLHEYLPLEDLTKLGLSPRSMAFAELESFFPNLGQPVTYREFGVDTGTEYVGVLKLLSLGKYELSYATLAAVKDSLPQPFEIVLHQKKISRVKTEMRLSQIAKREANPTNATEAQKSFESEDALRKVELKGECHFSFEMHILFRRSDETSIKEAHKRAIRTLTNIGDFTIETTVGALPSYLSTLPGTDFHFAGPFSALTEEHQKLPCFLPIFTRGASNAIANHPSAFAFHRLDYSVDFYSVFNRSYKNYCAVVVGQAGSGKSVALNRLISCSTYNPKSRIIIVDVRGSHTRLVKNLDGNISNIELTKPSGINVFSFLEKDRSEYSIGVVATFISELMLEEEERKISEEEMFDLTTSIQDYINSNSNSNNPNLDSFIKSLPEAFPRKKLLQRFSSKGLFKHLFSSTESTTRSNNNRINYYNFESIDLASNRSAARAIMAAIMADFNFQLANKKTEEELIFLSDETPFFIEQCFRSFKLLNKNVRKLNGSLILTVQVSTDLIIDGDESLIANSDTKFLLSYDSSKEAFSKRFQLNPDEAEIMWTISPEKGQYSQFLLKDKNGSRVGHLILTPKEYWQSTTESYDVARIQKIATVLPELSEDTILNLLALSTKESTQQKTRIMEANI